MPPEAHRELSKVFDHYQNSSHLRVAIIYGKKKKIMENKHVHSFFVEI